MYLTPSKERYEESVNHVKKIAEMVKKSFIILNLEFVMLKEHNIIDNEKNFDLNKFLNKLPDLTINCKTAPRYLNLRRESFIVLQQLFTLEINCCIPILVKK